MGLFLNSLDSMRRDPGPSLPPTSSHFGQKTRRGPGNTARRWPSTTQKRNWKKGSRCCLGAGLWCPGSAAELTDAGSLSYFLTGAARAEGTLAEAGPEASLPPRACFLGRGITPYLGCFLPPAPVHCSPGASPTAHVYTRTHMRSL